MDFLRKELPKWPWSDSLAGVLPDPSRVYRMTEIGSSFAKERCESIGIEPGTRVRPRITTPDWIVVELPDAGSAIRSIEEAYAWYVRVRLEGRPAIALPPWRRGLPSSIRDPFKSRRLREAGAERVSRLTALPRRDEMEHTLVNGSARCPR